MNLDNIKNTCICSFNASMGGDLPGSQYGVCLTIRGGAPSSSSDTWWIMQLAITADNHLYTRSIGDSWKQVS